MNMLRQSCGSAQLVSWWQMLTISMCAAVLAGGLVTASVWADDDDKGYGHDPAARLEKLTKKLSLTEAQQAKIGPILEEKAKKMQALHEQMREAHKQAMDQIQAELTDEQKAKFQDMREKHQEKKEDKHGKHEKKKSRHGDD